MIEVIAILLIIAVGCAVVDYSMCKVEKRNDD